jgi:valyl-tRNA synthetase
LQGSRNFANKIWNVTRFILSAADMSGVPATDAGKREALRTAHLELADRWILSRHNSVTADATRLLKAFQIGEAARYIHDFLWSEMADWYVESAKARLYGNDAEAKKTVSLVLAAVMERSMRLLHPFMPFVTEELWQYLPHDVESIMVAAWPEPWEMDAEAEKDFGMTMEIVKAVRNARAEAGVEPGRWIEAEIVAGDNTAKIESQRDEISRLARIDSNKLRVVTAREGAYPEAVSLVTGDIVTYLPLAGLIDLEAERARLSKDLGETEILIRRSEELLDNEGFTARAPEQVVAKEREKLAANMDKARTLSERLASLG